MFGVARVDEVYGVAIGDDERDVGDGESSIGQVNTVCDLL